MQQCEKANPIRIGLVGLGRAGRGFHVPDMLERPDQFKIVAACDIIFERAEKLSQECGCSAYDNIDDLLKNEEVEVVDIATRNCDHYQMAVKALAAGKDVMLEKPVTLTDAELADLLSKTNKPGLPKLILRHNRRLEPGFMEMMKILKSGVLGNVFEVQLSEYGYQRRDDWQTISDFGGGQMLNWGPHLIDHALQFLGAPVTNMVVDNIQAAAGGDCEDHFSIRLRGENKRFVTVAVSGCAALNQGRTYTMFGTRGAAVMHGCKIHLRYIDPQQVLAPVVSDPKTPGSAFGSTGTFASDEVLNWIEEDREVGAPKTTDILEFIYGFYRCDAPFAVKDEEILHLMEVITKAKQVEITRAETIF